MTDYADMRKRLDGYAEQEQLAGFITVNWACPPGTTRRLTDDLREASAAIAALKQEKDEALDTLQALFESDRDFLCGDNQCVHCGCGNSDSAELGAPNAHAPDCPVLRARSALHARLTPKEPQMPDELLSAEELAACREIDADFCEHQPHHAERWIDRLLAHIAALERERDEKRVSTDCLLDAANNARNFFMQTIPWIQERGMPGVADATEGQCERLLEAMEPFFLHARLSPAPTGTASST